MSVFTQLSRVFERSGERPFMPSAWRTAAFVARRSASNAMVGRRFRIIDQGHWEFPRNARLRFGTGFYGFMNGDERGLIRNRGTLTFAGDLSVGAGSRWDVGPEGIIIVGAGTYFSPNTLLVASERISFGEGCAIGWDVQIIDSDFHAHGMAGLTPDQSQSTRFRAPVEIGHHVWIGSGAKIFKGVRIADGCIIGGGAVVTRSVTEPGSVIAGNPARVVKTGVEWK